ncbi:MAG: cysteine desulfurase family protein, partial [Candidatus Omnitrophica bacterium]|nr:cysteine desulfurase family protein [Candidatus Omnitrophota bacterium]
TTPLHPEVKKTMIEAMDNFGNPSSFHSYGRKARVLIEEAREKIASFIGASPDEIIFVGSGSEANNTVLSIFSCLASKCTCSFDTENVIITTPIEHPCILEKVKCFDHTNTKVKYADVDKYGKVDIGKLEKEISDNTILVSIMMANNEIGTIQDIKRITDIVHAKKIMMHTDAVQAVGRIPVNVKDLGVDFLTISAHKIYGPKGVGALYVKRGLKFCPLIYGGHQEKGRRAGTENTLGIIGFGKAVELRAKEMFEESKRLLQIKKHLKEEISSKIEGVYFNGHPDDCLPGTLNVSFDGIEGESLLLYLDLEGIALSTGSACASGSLDPSHVLLAIGQSAEHAHSSLRISLGRENTLEEADYLIEKLVEVVQRLRKMSTAYV